MKKAIAYYRYSSHKQTETSIEGQQAAAREWAAAHGYEIVQEYADRAQSGTTADRDDFQRMLREVDRLRPDTLIVWKVDRLGRNREAVALTKYRLKKAGCSVTYLAEAIPDGPEGVILESVLEGMAEFYSLQLAQNVRRGMAVNASKGLWHGGHVPLGYMIRDKRLVPDPETAPVVRQIYEWYLSGDTTAEIIRRLNDMGLRTTSGKPYTRNSLRTVLHNRKYIGENVSMGYASEIEPLISVELFEAVQLQQAKNHRVAKRKDDRADYLLSGKLFCGACGSLMTGMCGTGRHGDRHYYYRCGGKSAGCSTKNERRDDIEGAVISATKRLLFDDSIMEHIAACTWEYYRAHTDAGLLDSLRGQLAEAQASLGHLVDALAGGLTSPAVMSRVELLEAQVADLTQSIQLEERREAAAPTEDFIRAALLSYRETDFEDRAAVAALLAVFVNAVYVWPDRLVIGYNYRDGEQTISRATAESAAAGGVRGVRGMVYQSAHSQTLVFLPGVVLVQVEKESVM